MRNSTIIDDKKKTKQKCYTCIYFDIVMFIPFILVLLIHVDKM